MGIADAFFMKVMLASLEPETLLAWCVLVLRHGTMGRLRSGCDRCCPTRVSSSACSEDKVSSILREQVEAWRWQRRRGGRGAGGWRRRLRGGLHGFLPGQSSAAFCGADHRRLLRAWTRFKSALWSTTSRRPASASDAGLVAPFSDVINSLAQISPGNLDIISTSSFSGRHSPSCLRVNGRFWKNFLLSFYVTVDMGT